MKGITIPPQRWYIDTNVLAHWVLGKGGVLQLLCEQSALPDQFFEIYSSRYEPSLTFVNTIIDKKNQKITDNFFVSHLAINELFSAIRDEMRSILLFNKGCPISMWRNPRYDPIIDAIDYQAVYKQTLQAFIPLFEDGKKDGKTQDSVIQLMVEQSPESPNYWDVYSSILFMVKEAKTHDATLLTSAILDKADYFVTLDKSLIKNAKKMLNDQYNIHLVTPKESMNIFRTKQKSGRKQQATK
jgi:predicted nucleic acid-binding protein